MEKIPFLLILLFVSSSLFSQKIENVHAEQRGKQVVITYDITGAQSGQTFDVKLLYSQNGYDWKQAINGLTGDIGSNVTVGSSKIITWDVLQDADRLVGTGFMFKVEAVVSGGGFTGISGTFADTRDGKSYKWVIIGYRTWMAETLHYNTKKGSWCYIDSNSTCEIYGRLYNWETAITVCPIGWHLPTDDEWTILTNFLGSKEEAGGKMKQSGTTYWNSPNTGSTNNSSFNALPGGYCYDNGYFSTLCNSAFFWSSTEDNTSNAWSRGLYYNNASVNRLNLSKTNGFSVRCVQD